MATKITLRIRTDTDVKNAFDQWWVRYRRESGRPTANQGEALEALLREKVVITERPMKGQVFS